MSITFHCSLHTTKSNKMKKTGQFLFESKIKWIEDTKGLITSLAVADSIKVATPKVFKGIGGDMWSPEHLLISAVSSCFMTTYLFYAKQKGLAIFHFECEAIGQVKLENNKLKFTVINIYPKVEVEKQEWADLAKEVIELTKQNCLVAKALSVIIYYHPSIKITKQPSENKPQRSSKKREVFF